MADDYWKPTEFGQTVFHDEGSFVNEDDSQQGFDDIEAATKDWIDKHTAEGSIERILAEHEVAIHLEPYRRERDERWRSYASEAVARAERLAKKITEGRVIGTKVETDRATEMIGVGVHTGLRKGTEAPDAHDIWMAISDSETTAWHDAAGYAVWALEYMGYAIVKVRD